MAAVGEGGEERDQAGLTECLGGLEWELIRGRMQRGPFLIDTKCVFELSWEGEERTGLLRNNKVPSLSSALRWEAQAHLTATGSEVGGDEVISLTSQLLVVELKFVSRSLRTLAHALA